MTMKNIAGGLAAAALLALSSGAFAQSTWNLGGSSCNPGAGSPNTTTCSSGSESANMYAFGNSGSGTTFTQGTMAAWDPNGFGAYVGADSGSPNHAFDSLAPTGSTELMLIEFGPYKVNLSSVAVGWMSGDADISILRWDGANVADVKSLVNGKNTSQLLSSGWTLVGSQDLDAGGLNYNNPNTSGTGNDAYKSTMNLGNQVSSYWIISTYFGSTSGNLQSGDDAFKLLNFAANVCTAGTYTGGNGGNGGTCGGTTIKVPEPTTLAVLSVALLGAGVARRRARRG